MLCFVSWWPREKSAYTLQASRLEETGYPILQSTQGYKPMSVCPSTLFTVVSGAQRSALLRLVLRAGEFSSQRRFGGTAALSPVRPSSALHPHSRPASPLLLTLLCPSMPALLSPTCPWLSSQQRPMTHTKHHPPPKSLLGQHLPIRFPGCQVGQVLGRQTEDNSSGPSPSLRGVETGHRGEN